MFFVSIVMLCVCVCVCVQQNVPRQQHTTHSQITTTHLKPNSWHSLNIILDQFSCITTWLWQYCWIDLYFTTHYFLNGQQRPSDGLIDGHSNFNSNLIQVTTKWRQRFSEWINCLLFVFDLMKISVISRFDEKWLKQSWQLWDTWQTRKTLSGSCYDVTINSRYDDEWWWMMCKKSVCGARGTNPWCIPRVEVFSGRSFFTILEIL